ncbi:GNAT family N-acetyltransferase [Ulvibacterium sp.]|uniref:GNAT family N-acetyltransferase n=1 Tax=Ulvibacterium sp. TaxID=2665914 RepID=UPI003BABA2E6
MKIISVRENPNYKDKAIAYFQKNWKSVLPVIYEDCITHSIGARNPLPQWYVLEKNGKIIGCAGLITNDFISRGDLYPWVCALFIEERHRGHAYGALLLEQAKRDTKKAGFEYLYLCTEHIGYYEKYGFHYIGQGYHPWGEESRIYELELK